MAYLGRVTPRAPLELPPLPQRSQPRRPARLPPAKLELAPVYLTRLLKYAITAIFVRRVSTTATEVVTTPPQAAAITMRLDQPRDRVIAWVKTNTSMGRRMSAIMGNSVRKERTTVEAAATVPRVLDAVMEH